MQQFHQALNEERFRPLSLEPPLQTLREETGPRDAKAAARGQQGVAIILCSRQSFAHC